MDARTRLAEMIAYRTGLELDEKVEDCADALIREFPQLAGWDDISSAPKDGTDIDLAWRGHGRCGGLCDMEDVRMKLDELKRKAQAATLGVTTVKPADVLKLIEYAERQAKAVACLMTAARCDNLNEMSGWVDAGVRALDPAHA